MVLFLETSNQLSQIMNKGLARCHSAIGLFEEDGLLMMGGDALFVGGIGTGLVC